MARPLNELVADLRAMCATAEGACIDALEVDRIRAVEAEVVARLKRPRARAAKRRAERRPRRR